MADFLERIEIGNTGLLSSRLGIGSTFDASTAVIEDAFERGINYLYWGTVRQPDFARAMVNLSKHHRDELILTVQSYSQDPSSIEGEVEDALKTAGIENFDFLLLGNRNSALSGEYVELFERLRDRGLLRYMSLSSHNRPFLPSLLENYEQDRSPFELLMLRYNPVHRGAETDVFPLYQKENIPRSLHIRRRVGDTCLTPTKCHLAKSRLRLGIVTDTHFPTRPSTWLSPDQRTVIKWAKPYQPLRLDH